MDKTDNKLSDRSLFVLFLWVWAILYGICLTIIGQGALQSTYVLFAGISFPVSVLTAVVIGRAWKRVMDDIENGTFRR